MEYKYVKSGETWLVEQTTALAFLGIAEGAAVTAPAGKSLTLSCDGVQLDLAPGYYQGDVTLTVTDDIDVTYRELQHKYRAAVCVEDGRYLPEKSVAAARTGGTVTDAELAGAEIRSSGEAFSGVYVKGGGSYTIRDTVIDAAGNGGNDFFGFGAGICVHGSAEVTVENCDVTTRGAARNAAFVGEDSRVTFDHCRLHARNGVLPPDYVDTVKLGVMKAVPWMLGLRGNCRATNLCQNASVVYRDCTITAGGWGVLSSDDLTKGSFDIINSRVEITGPSGYGIFAIGECDARLDHAYVKVPDYGFIFAGNSCSGSLKNGTVVESDRFAMQIGAARSIDIGPGCRLRGDETVFLDKDGAGNLNVDGAVLESASGIMLHMVINDDPRSPTGYFVDPQEEEVRNPELDLTTWEKGEDAICCFANMEICGDFYNGSAKVKGDTGPQVMMAPPPSTGPDGAKAPAGPPPGSQTKKKGARNLALSFRNTRITGVISASRSRHCVPKITKDNCREISHYIPMAEPAINNGVIVLLEEQSTWTVSGTSYLTRLDIKEGSTLKAPEGKTLIATADGVPFTPSAGSYCGAIVLRVE